VAARAVRWTAWGAYVRDRLTCRKCARVVPLPQASRARSFRQRGAARRPPSPFCARHLTSFHRRSRTRPPISTASASLRDSSLASTGLQPAFARSSPRGCGTLGARDMSKENTAATKPSCWPDYSAVRTRNAVAKAAARENGRSSNTFLSARLRRFQAAPAGSRASRREHDLFPSPLSSCLEPSTLKRRRTQAALPLLRTASRLLSLANVTRLGRFA